MSSEVKGDNIDNDLLMRNSFITIIIILLIIYGIPSIFYGLVYQYRKSYSMPMDVDGILEDFIDKKEDLNMVYNSLYRDIYLFTNFISIRKLVLCDGTNNEDNELQKEYNVQVKKIFEKLKKIKIFCDNEYDTIKKNSDKQIDISKKIREDQEHEIELLIMKEAGENSRHNSTSTREWITYIISGIFNTFKFTSTFMLSILTFLRGVFDSGRGVFDSCAGLVMPILSACLKNKVITGFLILIFIIVIVLYGIKSASGGGNSGGSGGSGGMNYSSDNQNGFSPSAVYYELLDTYKYYTKMANNFNLNDYTGNLLGNTVDENNGYYGSEEDGINIKRPELNGKRYDNLSYFDLKKLKIDNINDGNQDIKTEENKYYNVYLPSEKFRVDDKEEAENKLPWNIYASSKTEKIWKLDCETVDYIVKDGAKKSAFITDGDKCKINEVGLRDAFASDISNEDDILETIYTTEYIK
jgi:hypothetical protein